MIDPIMTASTCRTCNHSWFMHLIFYTLYPVEQFKVGGCHHKRYSTNAEDGGTYDCNCNHWQSANQTN